MKGFATNDTAFNELSVGESAFLVEIQDCISTSNARALRKGSSPISAIRIVFLVFMFQL